MKKELIEISHDESKAFQDALGNFANEMRERTKEIHGDEVALLKDESAGLWVELHSQKIPANELINIAGWGFKFLKEQRAIQEPKPLPTGVQ